MAPMQHTIPRIRSAIEPTFHATSEPTAIRTMSVLRLMVGDASTATHNCV